MKFLIVLLLVILLLTLTSSTPIFFDLFKKKWKNEGNRRWQVSRSGSRTGGSTDDSARYLRICKAHAKAYPFGKSFVKLNCPVKKWT
ncbi:hypothetical protein GWI33_015177 [Rhynchophorus ferrugineus]|uniref:Uncharacterized protein n=1 Tax=Rhynchophorus ferrugineus TaxID=354439 RepID=A0A834MBP2_RHYFE|nr:hypothetical protein GWI33_015177 [Rhynchophorus ferrugineus]